MMSEQLVAGGPGSWQRTVQNTKDVTRFRAPRLANVTFPSARIVSAKNNLFKETLELVLDTSCLFESSSTFRVEGVESVFEDDVKVTRNGEIYTNWRLVEARCDADFVDVEIRLSRASHLQTFEVRCGFSAFPKKRHTPVTIGNYCTPSAGKEARL